jgi:HlyD family secretion protein/epimerase transport system membrane fusion protein
VIDDKQASTTVDILRNQHHRLLASQVRLEAELNGASLVVFPSQFMQGDRLDAIAASQLKIFETRRASVQARKDVLGQRLEQLNELIKGYRAQLRSVADQLVLVREEGEAKTSLVERGLISKPEAFRLKRMDADLAGRQGELTANVARTQQQIGETEMQLVQINAERVDQIANESDKVRLELAEVTQKLRSAEDVLRRTIVTAPVAGKVVNLRVKTIGGIVQRGEPLLDIVPGDDALVIEARVAPIDINIVQAGLPAHVHLGTHASQVMPSLSGVVRSVSPDRLIDQATRQPYYLARVEINRDDVQRLSGVELIPGMSADVLVVAKERSMLGYLLQPLSNALWRSLREV